MGVLAFRRELGADHEAHFRLEAETPYEDHVKVGAQAKTA